MVSFYRMLGISKQAHYKRISHQEDLINRASKLLEGARILREEHKRMGCRKMYFELNPLGLGRDRAESILLSNGFRVKRKCNYTRTTYAGKQWYSNAIQGLLVTDVNQLWVSDITYLPVGYRHFYYLTLILDVYSRKIVGWSLSAGMKAHQTVIPAYQMALKLKPTINHRLIFHTDRGSQYYCHQLDELHQKNNVQASMGGKAWENAHAESLNGILKNEYINFDTCKISINQAKAYIKNIITKYNIKRPHGSLKGMKPVQFEKYLTTMKQKEKPIFKINY